MEEEWTTCTALAGVEWSQTMLPPSLSLLGQRARPRTFRRKAPDFHAFDHFHRLARRASMIKFVWRSMFPTLAGRRQSVRQPTWALRSSSCVMHC